MEEDMMEKSTHGSVNDKILDPWGQAEVGIEV
jgi:hypothetical protein